MNINDKAIKKNKLDNDCFTIVREYIQSRTTIDVQEQLEIDENLLKLGILEKGESTDVMSLNINTLAVLMMGTDEQLIDKARKTKRKSGKPTKAEAIKQNLKNSVRATNAELREAYYGWIDAVFDRQGWMSKKGLTVAEDSIDSFTNRNLDVALKILEIASIHGYRDIQWAINKYNEEFRVSYSTQPAVRKVVTANSQLSSEVF